MSLELDEQVAQLPVKADIPIGFDLATATHIGPIKGWTSLQLHELWERRGLLYFLIWRDLKVRYKQTALGASWALVQPFMTMLVFSIVFGRLAKMPSDGIPYPIFAYAGLVPWMFFQNALTRGSNSLVGHANLITKIYFPRLLLPFSAVLAGIVDFLIAVALQVAMMAYYHIAPSANTIWVLFFLALALICVLGVSLWFSALAVKYRDVGYIVPFLSQIWFFASPVAYPSSLFPAKLRLFYALNPMVGAIEGFRWAVLNTRMPSISMIASSCAVAMVFLVSGAFYFRKVEATFADVV